MGAIMAGSMPLKRPTVRLLVVCFLLVASHPLALEPRLRLRARLAYDGRAFHGVQRNMDQDGAPLRTVLSTLEGALQDSLRPAAGAPARFGLGLKMAGRTDAGVSATGAVCTFDCTPSVSPPPAAACSSTDAEGEQGEQGEAIVDVNGLPTPIATLADALNELLPPDLQIVELSMVPPAFDVGASKYKRYVYSLPAEGDADRAPLLRLVASHAARMERRRRETTAGAGVEAGAEAGAGAGALPRRKRGECPPLACIEEMQAAASALVGTHDMAAFQAKGGDQMGTVRTIYRCSVEPRVGDLDGDGGSGAASGDGGGGDGGGGDGGGGGGGFDIVVEGDGFLYKQVRIMAGTLVMVGMGLADPGFVGRAICAPDPSSAGRGPALPPERLRLVHVEFDEDHPGASRLK